MNACFRNAGRLLVVLMSTASGGAFAQSAAPDDAAKGLEEIVVTARRVSENVQNVPATIQAISAEALIQRGIKNESDLQGAVPGLLVHASNNQNQLNYVIRGAAVEAYSGSTPGVQPYFNEVALSGNAAVAFYDVESVQVLKGPQGTLFGRNSTGGAVLYQAAAPKSELGGWGSIQYGNHDKLIIEGALNLPISPDKVLLRVAGTYQSGGAFVTNTFNGKKIGDTKVRSGRITLKLQPTETITNVTMAQYSKYSGTNGGNRVIYADTCGGAFKAITNPMCWAFDGNPFYNSLIRGTANTGGAFPAGYPNGGFIPPGGYGGLEAYLDSQGKFKVNNDGIFPFGSKDKLLVNNTTFEVTPDITIKNIFGYHKTNRAFAYDNDSSFLPLLYAGGNTPGGDNLERRNTRLITDELQLQGEAMDGRLKYILGFFISDSKTNNNSPIAGSGYIQAFGIPYFFALRYKSESIDKSKAVFAQLTYAVTDALNVTAGIRQAWDKLSLEQSPQSSLFVAAKPKLKSKQDDLSWNVSVDYRFSPDVMAYVTTRGSWRVGGYNPFVAASLVGSNGQPIDPDYATAEVGGTYFPQERVRDIELGVKYSGYAGGVPVRLNADIYNTWIKNVQKTAYGIVAGNITSTTTIVPEAKVTGFEVDGEIRPAEWLKLGSTFSYSHARYTKNIAIAFGTLNAFGPYADAPKYSGSAYGEVTAPLSGDTGTLVFHLDGFAVSKVHVSSLGNTLNPNDTLPGYIKLNGRIDWEDPMGVTGLTASFFMKNITNKQYYIGGGGGIQLFAINSGVFGESRTFGGVLRYSF